MAITLADLIRARRRARGLTLEDLAARIDCESSTVRRWERGVATPGPRHMPALRAILDIPLDLLDEACLAALTGGGRVLRVESAEHMERTGKSWNDMLEEIIALDLRNLHIEDMADEGTVEQWIPIHRMIPDAWRVLADGDRIVGDWHIVPLTDEAFARVLGGRLRDGEITADLVEPPAFPGLYNAYLASFVLDPPYRYGAPFQMLFDSLAEQLGRFAKGGVFFREVATPGFTHEGRRLLERLGCEIVAPYPGDPAMKVYRAPLRGLLQRPEFRRFELLRQLYDGE